MAIGLMYPLKSDDSAMLPKSSVTSSSSSSSVTPKTQHTKSASSRESTTNSTLTPSPSPTPKPTAGSTHGSGSHSSSSHHKSSSGDDDDVTEILKKLKLEKYQSIFEQEEVTILILKAIWIHLLACNLNVSKVKIIPVDIGQIPPSKYNSTCQGPITQVLNIKSSWCFHDQNDQIVDFEIMKSSYVSSFKRF